MARFYSLGYFRNTVLATISLLAFTVFQGCSHHAAVSVPAPSAQLSASNSLQPVSTPEPEPYEPDVEKDIWSGQSGGFDIRWTTKDIYVEKDGKTRKLFSNFAAHYYDAAYAETLQQAEFADSNSCTVSIEGKIVSLVGNYLVWEVQDAVSCENQVHPSFKTSYMTFDLSQAGMLDRQTSQDFGMVSITNVRLTEIFPDKEVLRELMQNATINNAIKTIQKEFTPRSTAELLSWFENRRNDSQTKPDLSHYYEDLVFVKKITPI